MSRRRLSLSLRAGAALLLLLAIAGQAFFPRPAWAACGPLDMGACIDNAEYSFYYLIASIVWGINRSLLLLAYQLDQLRAWLVTIAFSGAYQWLTSFVQPVYIPIATAALMLAAILFMLVPITGETGFVNLRHVVIWAVMTPVVLVVAGQLIGQAEQVRSDVSTQLFTQMSQVAPGAIFGSPGSDMAAPTPLYPANPCGTTLVRTGTTGLAMDSLAASFQGADANDVHCLAVRGPSPDIPDSFYNSPPGYAYDGYVGDLDSAVERRGWVEGMQRGMNRLLQGIIPSFLAVLESLIHLVFSLSMAVLWLSLPIGLIFVWFQQTASPISSVLRRAASVLIVSWMSSIVMGVLSAALLAAAELGNAAAYSGMAFGGLFLMGYLCILAFSALWKSIGTVEQTALSIAGMSFTQPLQTAAQLATAGTVGVASGVASGVVSGGSSYLGMAAMGSAAFAQSRDASLGQRLAYTTSAMVGRVPGAGAVGEVAAAMGWLDTDAPVYEGLYAGERSRHSWRSARLQMERDTATMGAPSTGGLGGRSGPSGGSSTPTPTQRLPRTGSTATPALAPAPHSGGIHSAPTVPLPPVAVPSGAGSAPASSGRAQPQSLASVAPASAAQMPAHQPISGVHTAPTTSMAPSGSFGSPNIPSSAPSLPSALPIGQLPTTGQAAPTNGPATSPTTPAAPVPTSQLSAPPAAQSLGPRSAATASSADQLQQLPAANAHLGVARSRIPPLPNNLHNGVDWAYSGSVGTGDGYRHTFRHPNHPLTGRPEERVIETSAAEVAQQRHATGDRP
jgi:hypothetical protein